MEAENEHQLIERPAATTAAHLTFDDENGTKIKTGFIEKEHKKKKPSHPFICHPPVAGVYWSQSQVSLGRLVFTEQVLQSFLA